MGHLVLVTRPIEQARDFVADVEKLGLSAIIQPLLQIEYIPFSYTDFEKPDAILVTSIHSLGQESPPESWAGIPVFTVGQKTREIAGIAGFKTIFSGTRDISEVIPLIQKNIPKGHRVLYLRGEYITHDIRKDLSDYYIEEKITYSAKAVENIEDAVLRSFTDIGILTLFSPRSGKILSRLLEKYNLGNHVPSIKLLCLSQAVLESVKELPWKSCHVANNPTTRSMIEALERLRNE